MKYADFIRLFPNVDDLTAHAAKGQWAGGLDEWVQRPDVLERCARRVDRANQHFPQFERVKRWELVAEVPTLENGMLTPTMKTKRPIIEAHFAAVLDDLYAADAADDRAAA